MQVRPDSPGREVVDVAATVQIGRQPCIKHLQVAPTGDRECIIGNSMTPDFLLGQKVLVDTEDRTHSPPGVFMVWDGLSLVVKALEYIPYSEPPEIRISSKNADYRLYERGLEAAYIQVRVVGRWQ